MRTCLPCEVRTWEYEGQAAAVGTVLDAMAENRRSFMRPGSRVAA